MPGITREQLEVLRNAWERQWAQAQERAEEDERRRVEQQAAKKYAIEKTIALHEERKKKILEDLERSQPTKKNKMDILME